VVVLLTANGFASLLQLTLTESLSLAVFFPATLCALCAWHNTDYCRIPMAQRKDREIGLSLLLSVGYIFVVIGILIAEIGAMVRNTAGGYIFMFLSGSYVLGALFNGREAGVLWYFPLYLFAIPSAYLVMVSG
jgi:hypothetical protein